MSDPANIQYNLKHEKGRPVFELLHSTSTTNSETISAESLNHLAKSIEIKQKWLLLDSPMNIHHDGSIVGNMEFVWTNDIVVYLKDSIGNAKIYQIISKGFFNRYFILQDEYDQILLSLVRIQKENIVEIKGAVEDDFDACLLLVLFGYAIELIKWR